MPRPRKCRRVCSLPNSTLFGPQQPYSGQDVIIMTVDEYETIRLIDLEGLTQEQCAEQMAVARTTVQASYAVARRKLAECIVHSCQLKIAGGDIQLCEHSGHDCICCCKQHRSMNYERRNHCENSGDI